MLGQIFIDDLRDFLLISREETLVETRILRQHRLIAQKRVQEFEHTVNGVESSDPTPPQSQVQKLAATMIATGDMPVLLP